MMATVEEPCAVFKIKVIKKGNNKPSVCNGNTALNCSPILVAASIAPNAPPAPMITKMPPAFSADSCSCLLMIGLVHALPQLKASNTPAANAITGSPKKFKKTDQPCADFSIDKKDLIAIKITGTITGKKAFVTEGGLCVTASMMFSAAAIKGVFLPMKFAHQLPAIMPGNAAIIPTSISFPKSTCIIPAAAAAPGCGGIKQCTAYKPVDKETVVITIEIFARFASDLLMPFKTMKPESQNTGMPTIKPVRLIAQAAFFSPVSLRINEAITLVLPVCSSSMPSVVPKTIISPSDFNIFPKPSLTVFTISATGICTPMPTTKQAISKAKKACI